MDICFFTIATFGALISLYFCIVFWGMLSSAQIKFLNVHFPLPEVCQNLFTKPQSRFLNIPNPLLGLFFYSFLIYQFFFFTSFEMALNLCGIAFIYSIYLTYQLIFKLRQRCFLCMVLHFFNAFLFLILMMKRIS